MANGDPLRMRFPGQHGLIGERRQKDAALAEICGDLELLDRLLGQNSDTLNSNTRKDILESIHALEAEIKKAIATNEHIKKDET